MTPKILVLLVAWATLLVPASAFLPTYLNYTDPDLEPVFCPSQMTEPTHNHKAITREALRREVRRFFLENPPYTNETFSIPENATLSEIFRAYYGPTSSPARFIKAVNSVTWSNAMAETSGQERFNTAYHMDGESILEGHALIQGRYQLLVATTTVDAAYDYARELLGTSLNGIQDFYSQTTWVELGRDGVLEELGLPGNDIGEVAGPDDATCTNCDDTTGECRDNVILSGRLSSGYYEYSVVGADDFLVVKPEGAGKCSHGGSLDTSVLVEATGGINKETSSPCFSPHHYLHQQAVDLATTASEHYIATLRDAIGDAHFLGLLDLYRGSALSIVIDITFSMSQELEAVKEEARLIVERTHPEVFVFVPYGDPLYGPVTKTTNETVFLEVLDALTLNGGCCCLEEKFWHGLQLALANTPDYSSVFCFTDAGANDAELMQGVMALATAKHCKVSIIYSYDNGKKKKEEDEGRAGQGRACPGYIISGTDEFKQLAELTGGLFVEIDKFDIDEVIGIMESGVEESQVTIRARDDVTGHQAFSFPIDNSVIDLQVLISGHITEATLTDVMGTSYNLADKDSLEAAENVEIISYTDGLKFITFTSPILGDWAFEVQSDGYYNLVISATSTLSFLSEFTQVELLPPRPGYVLIRGHPLAGETYYVEVELVGYLESGVLTLSVMEFVSKSGDVLSHVDYTGLLDDHMYILSEPLPPNAFYIQVDGFLETGTKFSRIFPTMATPVECLIELMEEESVLVANPGQTTRVFFRVYNYGPVAEFQYMASDEEEYIYTWLPKMSTIPSLGFVEVEVDFQVPFTATLGTTSTVTFTATSLLHQTNTNTYITYYLVVDSEKDTDPPTCTSTDVPDCSDHDAEDTCDAATWSVSTTLQDSLSGLARVFSRPNEGLTVDDFSDATNDPVTASFTASCCVREVDIIGVDKWGNVGHCKWDLGGLEAGWLLEFVVEAVGETWEYLRWSVSETRDDFLKYAIVIDNDFTETSRCPNLVCWLNVTYLKSCTLHTFDLTPHFSTPDGINVEGVLVTAADTTLGTVPGVPSNPTISYTTLTSTTFSWDPPSDDACLSHYLVCYTIYGTSVTVCVNSSSNNVTLEDLEACTLYHVTVSSVSIFGLLSDELKFDTNTNDAAPGAPENLVVSNQTANWVALSWDDPINRASCVDMWRITYGETATRKVRDPIITADNFATISPLLACTNYTFWVSGVSPKGLLGSTRITQSIMEETEPTPVSWLEANPIDSSTMLVVWTPGLNEECVTYYHVCATDIGDLVQNCSDTTNLEETFTGLEACVDYDVTVTPVSPSGKLGHQAFDIARTGDLRTSPPTNLQITDVTAHTTVVSYGPPEENPKCVKEYDTILIELGGPTVFSTSVSVHLEEMLSGLAACMNYGLKVCAVTASGFQSEFSSVNFTTGEDTPSAPRSLSHLGVTDTYVQLRWFVPQTNPWCAEMYRLAWSSSSDSGSRDVTAADHPPEVMETVDDLTPCTSYTFTVSALTLLGSEGPSTTYEITTTCS